ncbi:MAG: FecR domain-containing protein [Balneolaceae bacterium]|nr:FecR domain-containing protein [Balneolaceae bacterium]
MNLDKKQWLLIQRYVTGNIGPIEKRDLENWMAESLENRRLVLEVKEIWNQAPPEEFEVDVQHAWEQFRYRNQKNTRHKAPIIGYVRKKPGVGVYLFRAAAVLLVALFSGLFVYHQMNQAEQREAEQASIFNVLQELETDKGEKARVTFSDGTRVTLNSASSVQFPQEFRGDTREVFLEGEAYFEVAHNPDKPFIVHSQDAEIEVLGTEFNVRGWNEDPNVEVVVRGGKVSVQSTILQPDERTPVILTEGLKTELERGQNPMEPVRVDPVRHLLWTSGGMYFDNEPLHRVVQDLERRFNVNVTVEDQSLLNVPYTGTFQYAELDEVLTVIGASMEVGFSREGSEVRFH